MLTYAIATVLFLLYLIVVLYSLPFIKSADQISSHKFTLVFGAGIEKSGRPSDILMDRVNTGIILIQKEKSEFVIMSGGIDETRAMVELAKSKGISGSKILVDSDGISTLDSLKNFRVTHRETEVILVSQFFHLPRSIFLARILGIKAEAVIARGCPFCIPKIIYWSIREMAAIPYSLTKVILKPKKISR